MNNADTPAGDSQVQLDGTWHLACQGDYVVRLDGTTCLQLWRGTGHVTRLAGDPLQVAQWLQACHDAGIMIRMQINESHTPEQGRADELQMHRIRWPLKSGEENRRQDAGED
ncbi:hypothetical protein I6L53_23370 (plasmid) [Citrobacter farmeri]|nr:hypothetical protein I6L53_23370 [Citrobacter farmeri]